MSTWTHDEILRALTAYCEGHLRNRRGWQNTYGLTCDETGCTICNGEGAAQTAAWWLEAWENGPGYDEAGYQINGYTDLPFDPDDPEEMADWLEEDEAS